MTKVASLSNQLNVASSIQSSYCTKKTFRAGIEILEIRDLLLKTT